MSVCWLPWALIVLSVVGLMYFFLDLRQKEGSARRSITEKDFAELLEKILRCPSMFSGLVMSERKYIEPQLREEMIYILLEYFVVTK
ncbi:hypothetical protein HYT01_03005 [Candidatus Giovannonibacteria bacterium]|nr:hypothetical protein [Candidatus Giovannonibacteria bacterium]